MKNIITILLILIVPIFIYLVQSTNSKTVTAMTDKNNPSLLVFSSTMCMDCQKIKGVIQDVKQEYSNKINIVEINALDNNKKVKEQIQKYNVVLVPTLIFTDNQGMQTKKIEGYVPKSDLVKEIEALING
jgi:thioredoxin-related protein